MSRTASPFDRPAHLSVLHAESHPAVVELLWHERHVEVFGTLHRITVPLVGGESTAIPVDALARELTARWVGRPVLSPTATVTSVVAELQEDLGARRLVLLVTADALPRDHSVVNMRMVRDLRRAVRDLRRYGQTATTVPVPSDDVLAAAA